MIIVNCTEIVLLTTLCVHWFVLVGIKKKKTGVAVLNFFIGRNEKDGGSSNNTFFAYYSDFCQVKPLAVFCSFKSLQNVQFRKFRQLSLTAYSNKFFVRLSCLGLSYAFMIHPNYGLELRLDLQVLFYGILNALNCQSSTLNISFLFGIKDT
jgi:hypothetical protein